MGEATEQEVTRTVRFEQCNCNPIFAHGYFEDMSGGRIVGNPAMSKKKARQVLAQLSESGSMSPEEVALIEAEIEATPLAENEEPLSLAPQDIGGLLAIILSGGNSSTRGAPPYEGPYTFTIVPERDSELPLGQFLMADGSPVDLSTLRTKVEARSALDLGIILGSVREEERETLLALIESSELPEEETPEAIAERSRISFQVVEMFGEKVGWFLKGKKRIRSIGPQLSERGALSRIKKNHADYDRLVAEIKASSLPR